jgi:hypothetical protein
MREAVVFPPFWGGAGAGRLLSLDQTSRAKTKIFSDLGGVAKKQQLNHGYLGISFISWHAFC